MYVDLLDYGINLGDVIAGRIAPSLVLAVIAGLPLGSRTMSMMAAEKHGGEWHDWYGKGREWFLMADLYDALNQNTRASGQWAKKAPVIPPYPRPGGKKKATVQALFDRFSTPGGTKL